MDSPAFDTNATEQYAEAKAKQADLGYGESYDHARSGPSAKKQRCRPEIACVKVSATRTRPRISVGFSPSCLMISPRLAEPSSFIAPAAAVVMSWSKASEMPSIATHEMPRLMANSATAYAPMSTVLTGYCAASADFNLAVGATSFGLEYPMVAIASGNALMMRAIHSKSGK